jgi:hypothetical protein
MVYQYEYNRIAHRVYQKEIREIVFQGRCVNIQS